MEVWEIELSFGRGNVSKKKLRRVLAAYKTIDLKFDSDGRTCTLLFSQLSQASDALLHFESWKQPFWQVIRHNLTMTQETEPKKSISQESNFHKIEEQYLKGFTKMRKKMINLFSIQKCELTLLQILTLLWKNDKYYYIMYVSNWIFFFLIR
jgi:hypothetical protein